MDWDIAVQAKNEGLVEKLDRSKIPNISQVYDILIDKDGYLLGHFFGATIIAYNTNFVKEPPRSWKDLWDPKYKGKIALSDITGTAGYNSLIMINKAFGGDITNLDPAFNALKQLRGGIVTFFHHPDMLISLVERGEVWIATWYLDRTGAARKIGVPIASSIPKEGAVGTRGALSIAKGSKNRDLAEKYINMALTPECQKCMAENQFVGPGNKNVKISPEVARDLVYGREQIDSLYFPDSQYLSEHRAEWSERWNKEITK
jgi:putative spermidine/putrescine transport system substrate-binding protein